MSHSILTIYVSSKNSKFKLKEGNQPGRAMCCLPMYTCPEWGDLYSRKAEDLFGAEGAEDDRG